MSSKEMIITWVAIFIFTAVYGLLRRKRLTMQTTAVGFALATLLVAIAVLLPMESEISFRVVGLRWLINLFLFSGALRVFAKSRWQDSFGAGFFCATCLALLQVLT